ncbi:MAG TPA: hypothetical protein PK801_07910 [Aggregatilineales bacterium]|nr:hypothetical protein [Chloroflexota bacterium]HOA24730.1 hypothetical protein [Aggregatilineales bacterium]HPV07764.1 hypothetical protein [Aggregatilineales bacterium]HQA68233.1 hypothetical protein [Aggregatilineales bacterium]HQE18489.1 hypothetical protein [Aggregatilineales bacterium]
MPQTVYRVDPNHSNLRLAVGFSLVIGFMAGYFGVRLLFSALGIEGSPLLLGLLVGALFAVGVSLAAERVLRGRWPSGRELIVTDETVTLHEKTGEKTTLRWAEDIRVLAWGFTITSRRAWVPKGWICAALQLAKGDDMVTVYAFMKPEDARELPGWQAFVELIPRKEADRVPELFAEQEPLRVAEEARWWAGAEMEPDDFRAFAATVAERLPNWPEGGL